MKSKFSRQLAIQYPTLKKSVPVLCSTSAAGTHTPSSLQNAHLPVHCMFVSLLFEVPIFFLTTSKQAVSNQPLPIPT